MDSQAALSVVAASVNYLNHRPTGFLSFIKMKIY